MRLLVRVAAWVSIAVVVALVLFGMAAISELNEPGWFGTSEPGDTSLWWGVAIGLYYSAFVVPVIWLAVFVAYVVTLAVRHSR